MDIYLVQQRLSSTETWDVAFKTKQKAIQAILEECEGFLADLGVEDKSPYNKQIQHSLDKYDEASLLGSVHFQLIRTRLV